MRSSEVILRCVSSPEGQLRGRNVIEPLPVMAAPLQAILDAELANGNTITEVSAWPPLNQLLVILRHPFHGTYPTSAEVVFRDVNDPHYWKAEYSFNGGIQLLACSFA